MLRLKTNEDIKGIANSCALLSQLFDILKKEIRAGITTKYLDEVTQTFIYDNKAEPAFLGYMNYPA
ncbi:MAG TPA: type I methionyl aminopeptidase, partial [Spirochaetales bacterium]|nr:type I methionyl aminopeptidase [Spirochaetales bacterium]